LVAQVAERASESGFFATRVHALDGLRGVASLLVVLHHLGAPRLALLLLAQGHWALGFVANTVGASGVELFFVLSGAVLGRAYLRGGQQLRLLDYARRRLLRIFPPYLAAWTVTGLAFALNPWQGRFEWRAWLAQVAIVRFGLHYAWAWWSLTTEVLFYALVPLLIPALLRLPRRPGPMLSIFALSAVAAFIVPSTATFREYAPYEAAALLVYAPSFTAGLLLARVDLPASLSYASGVLGILALVGAARPSALSEAARHLGYALIYTCLAARASVEGGFVSRQMSRWRLIWLGERSYSLFLIHCAVMMLIGRVASTFGGTRSVVFRLLVASSSAGLSLFAAMLLFSLVERRFARGLVTAEAFWPFQAEPARTKIHDELPVNN